MPVTVKQPSNRLAVNQVALKTPSTSLIAAATFFLNHSLLNAIQKDVCEHMRYVMFERPAQVSLIMCKGFYQNVKIDIYEGKKRSYRVPLHY